MPHRFCAFAALPRHLLPILLLIIMMLVILSVLMVVLLLLLVIIIVIVFVLPVVAVLFSCALSVGPRMGRAVKRPPTRFENWAIFEDWTKSERFPIHQSKSRKVAEDDPLLEALRILGLVMGD